MFTRGYIESPPVLDVQFSLSQLHALRISQWLARGCKRQRVAPATAGAQAKKGWEAGGKHTLW